MGNSGSGVKLRTVSILPYSLAILGIILTAVFAVLFASAPRLSLVAASVGIFMLIFRLIRHRLAPLAISPITIATFGLLGLGVLGSAFYGDVQNAVAGGGATVSLTGDQTRATLMLLFVASASILGGGIIGLYAWPRITTSPLRGSTTMKLPPAILGLVLGLSFIPLLVLIIGNGANLLRRRYYIEYAVQDSGVLGFAGQLAIGALIALGYVIASAKGPMRVLAVVGVVAYFVVFFGGGSRRLAMLPLLVAVGMFAARRTKVSIVGLLAAVILSLYLIRLALYLRGLPSHGILPYLSYMPGFAQYGVTWDSIAKNILISFGIIGATAYQQNPIDPSVFWTSVNPLPGSIAGWYNAAPDLRINAYTPFAGVGELGNYGWQYVIGYFLVVGLVLAIFERQVQIHLANGLETVSLALVGLTGLFVLYAIQYNLRSATRMLLYGVAASVLISLVARRIVASRRKERGRLVAPSGLVTRTDNRVA